MNSKQIVAAISVIVLIFILVYPSVAVGSVSVVLASAQIPKADHVYITINRVWAHPKSQAAGTGWVVIVNQTVTADLVVLENSTKSLGSGQIASGDYDSVRIEVSNVTWVFNKTTTVLGVSSPEVDGTVSFTVGSAKPTTILITLTSQKQLIANSEYYGGTMNATVTG